MQSLLAEISLPRIRANARAVLRAAKKPLIAVVKDDAYGHGGEQVALALHGIASAFAVATAEEGAKLRTAGVGGDILVLTPPIAADDALRLIAYDLTACLSSPPVLRLLARAGETLGKTPRAHLCVNTGMNRYGYPAKDAERAARDAHAAGIAVEGVFSHLYLPESGRAREEQNALFEAASDGVRKVFPNACRHLSATGGIPFCGWDAVRAGIALYGYLPYGDFLPVKPAAKLYAFTAQTGNQTGGGLGYAAADADYGELHTLRLGYGDGFFREGAPFALGKLCMDACVCAGGRDFGRRELVIEDFPKYAAAHNTTVYEALVRLLSRAEKRYFH